MKSALIVIDCQVDMFEPALGLHDGDNLIARINQLIAGARAAGCPVFFVRNCGLAGDPDEPGTPGFELDPRLAMQRGDPIVDKQQADAFEAGELTHELLERGVKRVLLVGLQSEFCVDASARGAAQLGFDVALVADGHSTLPGSTQTAAEIIEEINRGLTDVVELIACDAVRFP